MAEIAQTNVITSENSQFVTTDGYQSDTTNVSTNEPSVDTTDELFKTIVNDGHWTALWKGIWFGWEKCGGMYTLSDASFLIAIFDALVELGYNAETVKTYIDRYIILFFLSEDGYMLPLDAAVLMLMDSSEIFPQLLVTLCNEFDVVIEVKDHIFSCTAPTQKTQKITIVCFENDHFEAMC